MTMTITTTITITMMITMKRRVVRGEGVSLWWEWASDKVVPSAGGAAGGQSP